MKSYGFNRPKVSVCIATYNGAKYIDSQIRSVISELVDGDEIVIIDDSSVDQTVNIVRGICSPFIKLIQSSNNAGVNRAFESALKYSVGEIIFLCDQDDIWEPGRVNVFLEAFSGSKALVVASNFSLIDQDGNYIFNYIREGLSNGLTARMNTTPLRNLISIFMGSAQYYGCAMAMRRSFVNSALPFPLLIENHDLWIAILANVSNRCIHLEEVTLMHRIHGANVSVINRSFVSKILTRFFYLLHILIALKRAYVFQAKIL